MKTAAFIAALLLAQMCAPSRASAGSLEQLPGSRTAPAAIPGAPAAARRKTDFAADVAQIMAIYAPKLAAEGVKLSFAEAHDGINGAWANRDSVSAVLGVNDGYYRNEKVTDDGFRMALCHEMGHIMGSAPRRPAPQEYNRQISNDGLMFESAEGEADYYASLKCMRVVLGNEDNVAFNREHGVSKRVTDLCDVQFPDRRASALCQRIAMAGANFLTSMAMQVPISFDTPSREVVERTVINSLPPRQCRLDTLLAGALCTVDENVSMSHRDPAIGACTSKNDAAGARPACWFREQPLKKQK